MEKIVRRNRLGKAKIAWQVLGLWRIGNLGRTKAESGRRTKPIFTPRECSGERLERIVASDRWSVNLKEGRWRR